MRKSCSIAFLADVVLTSCYLINRIPTLSIKNQVHIWFCYPTCLTLFHLVSLGARASCITSNKSSLHFYQVYNFISKIKRPISTVYKKVYQTVTNLQKNMVLNKRHSILYTFRTTCVTAQNSFLPLQKHFYFSLQMIHIKA